MSFNSVLFEIFSWLSASVLFKFSAVSKSSRQLLSDDFFIKKQCKNMKLVPDTCFLIQRPHCIKLYLEDDVPELHALSTKDTSIRVPQESLEFILREGPILASSNGLLCLLNARLKHTLCLFNPTTKNYLRIPNPLFQERKASYSVVLDCTSNQEEGYFLMALSGYWTESVSYKIYSPKLNIWCDGGKFDIGKRYVDFNYSVKVNEVIYAVSHQGPTYVANDSPFYWPYIVAYDINNSSSMFLSLPERARDGLLNCGRNLRIFKWGDDLESPICLVKLRNEVFSIWVLKLNLHHHDWTFIFEMPVKDLASTDDKVEELTVINGSVLLFATEHMVYSYDLKHGNNGKSSEVCENTFGKFVQFRSFSSTLRSCGSGATSLPASSLQSSTRPRRSRKFL